MADAFDAHLAKHGLTDIHAHAQKVKYRVRTANSYQFQMEYEGGLDKYYERGLAIKTFTNDASGKHDAIVFIANVQNDIDKLTRS
jgi:hypothetical protein